MKKGLRIEYFKLLIIRHKLFLLPFSPLSCSVALAPPTSNIALALTENIAKQVKPRTLTHSSSSSLSWSFQAQPIAFFSAIFRRIIRAGRISRISRYGWRPHHWQVFWFTEPTSDYPKDYQRVEAEPISINCCPSNHSHLAQGARRGERNRWPGIGERCNVPKL